MDSDTKLREHHAACDLIESQLLQCRQLLAVTILVDSLMGIRISN